MRVRRNVQHFELKLPKSTQLALITTVMVAVPTNGPNGCPGSPPPLSSQNLQSNKKALASHEARAEAPTISLTLGANHEGKERVRGKASRVPSSRIGSALVYVPRYAQQRELKLPESTRFVLITVVMVAVSPNEPTGCLVNLPRLSSQNIQPHKTSSTSHRARGEIEVTSLALGANREGKERVIASRIQSSRMGSALVCVRRYPQHLELKLPDSTRFVLITVAIVAVSTCGPTGSSVRPPPISSQNIQSHETSPTRHRARG